MFTAIRHYWTSIVFKMFSRSRTGLDAANTLFALVKASQFAKFVLKFTKFVNRTATHGARRILNCSAEFQRNGELEPSTKGKHRKFIELLILNLFAKIA